MLHPIIQTNKHVYVTLVCLYGDLRSTFDVELHLFARYAGVLHGKS
jgi:hypothetical protein